MALDNCGKFYLESLYSRIVEYLYSIFYLYPISLNILPEKKFAFSAFSSLSLTFSCGFFACMLTINRVGSVSKTSDTWWKFRYLPPTRKYRQYRYLVSVSCSSLLHSTQPRTYTLQQVCRHLATDLINKLISRCDGLVCYCSLTTSLFQVVNTFAAS